MTWGEFEQVDRMACSCFLVQLQLLLHLSAWELLHLNPASDQPTLKISELEVGEF